MRAAKGCAVLQCGSRALELSRPAVMGIVNVTPDSFSDGGRAQTPEAAAHAAIEMAAAGANIIDIGGESTRPGAAPVGEAEERRRLVPVIEALRGLDIPISVDTSKPGVARAAIAAGATMVNDVRAARSPGMLELLAEANVAICLMHMQGEPRTMQIAPRYGDVVCEVRQFLAKRVAACVAAGIERQRLLVDPGIGFGKTAEHNIALLRGLPALASLGVPVLAGVSRKGLIGQITGKGVSGRCAGSVAAAVFAVLAGASVVRVHDVAETVDALKVAAALRWPIHAAPGAIGRCENGVGETLHG